MKPEALVVGMSGGVDSAVAAARLVRAGYPVIGVTLKIWEGEEDQVPWHDRSCCKVGLARYVADTLGIPHRVVEAHEVFETAVIQDFCQGYLSGRTPNPCIRCNERVKFALLDQIARRLGASGIATGHYARVVHTRDGRVHLLRARDRSKDQSYFLYRVPESILTRTYFPLGEARKEEVWAEARALGLPVEALRESQEVCFVTRTGWRAFLEARHPEARHPGPIVDLQGRVLGTHPGVAFHTLGQRRGLGVAAGTRLYVVDLDPKQNRVVVGPRDGLWYPGVLAGEGCWIGEALQGPLAVEAQIRYRSRTTLGVLEPLEGGQFRVWFRKPLWAPTPGQSVVCYQGDRVLGGGVILKPLRRSPAGEALALAAIPEASVR